jgi:hypothetical protein
LQQDRENISVRGFVWFAYGAGTADQSADKNLPYTNE